MERRIRYSFRVENDKSATLGGLDSHLFLVRIWNEDLGECRSEWRAYVRHVSSGDARYVRTWDDLEIFLGRHAERPDGKSQSNR